MRIISQQNSMLINRENGEIFLQADLTGFFKFLGEGSAGEIKPVTESGFSSDPKVIAQMPDKTLFIRGYLSTDTKRIVRQVELMDFLYKSAFPVPRVYRNNDDNYLYTGILGNYVAYEFLEGTKLPNPNSASQKQLEEMAITLGMYHNLAAKFPVNHLQIPITEHINESELEIIILNTLNILQTKEVRDDVDSLILPILPRKLALLQQVKQNPVINTAITSLPKIVTHGDFHGANMVFDTNNKVRGVLDWEDSGIWMRAAEVQAAIAMNCKTEDTEHFNVPIDFDRARVFLEAYRSVMNLTQQELELMPAIALLDSLRLDFLLQNHYFQGRDMRKHMPTHPEHWFWWEENIARYSEEVVNIKF